MPKETSRVLRTKDEARANYDRLSRWYDLFAGSERRFTEAGLQMLAAREGEWVLEIGCGTGRALVELARAVGGAGYVSGIDISPGMLRVARSRLERSGLAAHVDLCLGDASTLPFPSNTLDAVFISFTLELFDKPEIPVVLGECKRVLCPGGRLGVVALAKQEHPAVRIYECFHARLPTLVDCRPIHVEESLRTSGYVISGSVVKSMWGLPVAVVIGRNP